VSVVDGVMIRSPMAAAWRRLRSLGVAFATLAA
jgi:hypothetical protein